MKRLKSVLSSLSLKELTSSEIRAVFGGLDRCWAITIETWRENAHKYLSIPYCKMIYIHMYTHIGPLLCLGKEGVSIKVECCKVESTKEGYEFYRAAGQKNIYVNDIGNDAPRKRTKIQKVSFQGLKCPSLFVLGRHARYIEQGLLQTDKSKQITNLSDKIEITDWLDTKTQAIAIKKAEPSAFEKNLFQPLSASVAPTPCYSFTPPVKIYAEFLGTTFLETISNYVQGKFSMDRTPYPNYAIHITCYEITSKGDLHYFKKEINEGRMDFYSKNVSQIRSNCIWAVRFRKIEALEAGKDEAVPVLLMTDACMQQLPNLLEDLKKIKGLNFDLQVFHEPKNQDQEKKRNFISRFAIEFKNKNPKHIFMGVDPNTAKKNAHHQAPPLKEPILEKKVKVEDQAYFNGLKSVNSFQTNQAILRDLNKGYIENLKKYLAATEAYNFPAPNFDPYNEEIFNPWKNKTQWMKHFDERMLHTSNHENNDNINSIHPAINARYHPPSNTDLSSIDSYFNFSENTSSQLLF